MKLICINVIIIVLFGCNNTGNNAQTNKINECTKSVVEDIIDKNMVKYSDSVTIGMKYKNYDDWSDFSVSNKSTEIIASKKMGKMLGVKDSIFIDNEGTLLSDADPIMTLNCISMLNRDNPKWLIISTSKLTDTLNTLTGVIQIEENIVYSAHCTLRDKKYIGGICLGSYPITTKDSIFFEIKEIYGILNNGKVYKLPLNTLIESCPEPFEPVFIGEKTPIYCYFVKGEKKYSQPLQGL